MRLMERYGASIAAACRSAISRVRLSAASAACLAVVMAVSMPGPLAGQDGPDWAPGTWAGTIDVGDQQLRIVYDISRGEDDTLRGSMAVPAQGASDIPLNELGVEGRTLSMSFPVRGGGSYEGELSASGTEIHGTFTQGPRSFPLDLERVDGEDERPSRPQEPMPPLPYRESGAAREGRRMNGVLTGDRRRWASSPGVWREATEAVRPTWLLAAWCRAEWAGVEGCGSPPVSTVLTAGDIRPSIRRNPFQPGVFR